MEPGVTVGELALDLELQGWMLRNYPSPRGITVVGAAATATHGSGRTGTLASFVVGTRIWTPEVGHVVLPPRWRGLASVHLGLLGIVTGLWLEVVPLVRLRLRTVPGTTAEAVEAAYRNEALDFVAAEWDWRRDSWYAWGYEIDGEAQLPSEALTGSGGGPRLEAEYLVQVPRGRRLALVLHRAAAVLRPHLARWSAEVEVGQDLYVRLVGPDAADSLSPVSSTARANSQSRPWVFVFVVVTVPANTGRELASDFFEQTEQLVRRELSGASHWGKLNSWSSRSAVEWYGERRLRQFAQAKAVLDPQDRFGTLSLQRALSP